MPFPNRTLRDRLNQVRRAALGTISDPWTVAAYLVVLLVGYNGLYRLVFSTRLLPEHVYYNWSIVVGALSDLQFVIVLTAPSVVLLIGWRCVSWTSFEHPTLFRMLILIVALPFVLTVAPYDYNYYFDQPHHFDRLLVLVLYALIWIHPIFVYLFLLILLVVLGQFNHPLGNFSLTDKRLPLNLLTLFSAFLFIKLRYSEPIRRFLQWTTLDRFFDPSINDEEVFLWAAAGLIGGSYFVPAVAKMAMLWPFRESIHYYIPLRYTRGWLGNLSQHTMGGLYRMLKALNPIAVWSALLIETSAVALMWRKRGTALIIGLLTTLHLLIFAASGIFFWKWILALWGFLGFVYYLDQEADWPVFSKKTAAIVTVLILLSPFLFHTVPLAWYTKNYNHVYTVEAVDESGNVHEVHWSEFEPYPYAHVVFSNRFNYLHSEPVLTGSDWEMVQGLRAAEDRVHIERLKDEKGEIECAPSRAENFDRFIQRYFTTYTERSGQFFWSSVPTPPHHWKTEQTKTPPHDRVYSHVRIRMTEYLVANGELDQLNSKIIRVIPLGESSTGAYSGPDPEEVNSC